MVESFCIEDIRDVVDMQETVFFHKEFLGIIQSTYCIIFK